MARRWWVSAVAAAGIAVLVGCGSPVQNGMGPGGDPGGADGLERMRQQAHDALARFDTAVLEAGGDQGFVPIGDPVGMIGNWEEANVDNKQAMVAGYIVPVGALPKAPKPTGTVVWVSGTTRELPLVSAEQTLTQLQASGRGDCQGCPPLRATGARLATARIQTTRGDATVPAWEFTLQGTAVRLTVPAVSGSSALKITPPSWDPYNSPGGLAIESATTTVAATTMTVAFTGSPGTGDKPCGIDYTAEAVESNNAVAVIIISHPHASNEMCTMIGARRTAVVTLAKPLGERTVLESQQGMPVAVNITP